MVGMLHGIAHPINIKSMGVDTGESVLRLLDLIFQRVEGFIVRNLNPDDMFDIVSKNRTIEQDSVDRATLLSQPILVQEI